VYDVTENKEYLDMAEPIFEELVDKAQPCKCGGIWWNMNPPLKATPIANSLFISAAAHLAKRVPAKKAYYLKWAQGSWDWFFHKRLIRKNWLVANGMKAANNCFIGGGHHNYYTYNQVISHLVS